MRKIQYLKRPIDTPCHVCGQSTVTLEARNFWVNAAEVLALLKPAESLTTTEVQGMVNGLAGRCRDCKWWGESWRIETGEDRHKDKHRCKYANGPDSTIATAPTFVGSGETVRMFTSADFGCVQWKTKETT